MDNEKGREPPTDDAAMIADILNIISSYPSSQVLHVSRVEIEFCLQLARYLTIEDRRVLAWRKDDEADPTFIDPPEKTTREVLADFIHILEHEPIAELKAVLAESPQFVDGEHINWAYYQRMGGISRFHDLFPLDKENKFKPVRYEWSQGKRSSGRTTPAQEMAPVDLSREAAMVPYDELDPDLIEMMVEDKATINNARTNDEFEKAVGFDDDDDKTFATGKPMEPLIAPVVSVAPIPPLPPMVTGYPPPQTSYQMTPASHTQDYTKYNFNAKDNLATLHSHPQNEGGAYNRYQGHGNFQYQGQMSDGQRYNYTGEPAQTTTRSPSPSRNLFGQIIQQSQQSYYPAQANQQSYAPLSSYGQYNQASNQKRQKQQAYTLEQQQSNYYAHMQNSMPASAPPQTLASQGIIHVSPTKTNLAMHRAFNTPMNISGYKPSTSTTGDYFTAPGTSSQIPTSTSGINPQAAAFTLPTSTLTPKLPQVKPLPKRNTSPLADPDSPPRAIKTSSVTVDPRAPAQGTAAYYYNKDFSELSSPSGDSASGTNTPKSTFSIGAGTSRGIHGQMASPKPRPMGRGGFPRRGPSGAATTQLRADSPAFTFSGLAPSQVLGALPPVMGALGTRRNKKNDHKRGPSLTIAKRGGRGGRGGAVALGEFVAGPSGEHDAKDRDDGKGKDLSEWPPL